MIVVLGSALVAGLTGCSGAPQARPGASADSAVTGSLLPTREPSESSIMRALATADSLIEAAVMVDIPGAVLVVTRDGAMIHERAFGYAQLNDFQGHRLATPLPMHPSAQFDLASVTKVAATTLAVMLLSDRGMLDVNEPVYRYLPDFRGPHLDSITVRHLLSHSAGLTQWQPLYYQASSATEAYALIRDMPLQWGVGEGRHYSDLGFMLLAYIVERASGNSLDTFLQRELYGPLGLHATLFRPRARAFTDFAATEQGNVYERHMVYDSTFGYRYAGDPTSWDGWRQYVLNGEVDDGNAWYAHDGVAGHAGLFSTAGELAVLVELLNTGGSLGGHRYLRPETVSLFLTLDRYDNYLGWMSPAEMPEGSFSHNGFTGTYVLGVPRYGIGIVLLTNRQNMGTDASGYFPNIAPLQAAVARAILAGVDGSDDAP